MKKTQKKKRHGKMGFFVSEVREGEGKWDFSDGGKDQKKKKEMKKRKRKFEKKKFKKIRSKFEHDF